MTIDLLLLEYWPVLLIGVALLIGAIVLLLRGRGQRISLDAPGDDDPVLPTLQRRGPVEPDIIGPGPIAGAIAMAVNATPEMSPLTRIKGLGPRIAKRLDDLGIGSIEALAALDETAQAALDAELGSFSGRMARDQWVEQARLLAAGDIAGFEARFGKLEGERG
ncbi:MAG: helix-hairpin-helix domain-containing protein [Sphingomonadaceae bacterium]